MLNFLKKTYFLPYSTSTSVVVIATSTIGAQNKRQFNDEVTLQARSAGDPSCTAPTIVRPTAVPAYASNSCGPASSVSARYSSACSCKGQTAKTITATASSAVATQTIASIAVPAICNNKGFQWFYYKSDYTAFDSPGHYDQFDPTTFDDQTPFAKGVTNTIGIPYYSQPDGVSQDYQSQNIYGQELPWDYYTIDHQAYFLAPIDGVYTIKFSGTDDLAVIYVGAKAYSGYKKDNFDFRATYYPDTNGQQSSASQSFNFVQGSYIPIRVFFTDANVNAGFDFTITGPQPFDQPGSLNDFFVQYSCDGSSAPAFPPLPQNSGSSSPQSGSSSFQQFSGYA